MIDEELSALMADVAVFKKRLDYLKREMFNMRKLKPRTMGLSEELANLEEESNDIQREIKSAHEKVGRLVCERLA